MKDGYIKVAAGSVPVRVADPTHNKQEILKCIQEADAAGVNLLVLPELCLTGYSCGDLFFHDVLLDGAQQALAQILEASAQLDMLVVVGMPVRREFIYTKKEEARAELGLDSRPLVVSAFGSLGAKVMNETMAGLFALEQASGFPYYHIHATGKYGWEWMPDHLRSLGIDPEAALEKLASIPVSMHCWQGDDVVGFDSKEALSGGIQTTGNYPGKATTPEELMADIDKACSLIPGKQKLNLHACYAIFEEGEWVDRDQIEYKHFAPWVEFAKENGIDSIGVTYGFGNLDELNFAGADYIISAPEEIFNIIS